MAVARSKAVISAERSGILERIANSVESEIALRVSAKGRLRSSRLRPGSPGDSPCQIRARPLHARLEKFSGGGLLGPFYAANRSRLRMLQRPGAHYLANPNIIEDAIDHVAAREMPGRKSSSMMRSVASLPSAIEVAAGTAQRCQGNLPTGDQLAGRSSHIPLTVA